MDEDRMNKTNDGTNQASLKEVQKQEHILENGAPCKMWHRIQRIMGF